MAEAWIVDAVRTPIGKHRGALRDVRPDDLAAVALMALVERNGLSPEQVDEVYLGCANQAGEDNRNVARMATLLAGLPHSVPAATVNRLCGSGMEAVIQGCRMIRLGEADVVLAGGVESMTRAPWVMPKPPEGFPSGKWELYDTHYTERFMGTPQADAEAYRTGSAIPNATKITDPLLIIHGMADDNVVFENATELIAAMQAANVPFEMMLYPGFTHRVSGEKISPHRYNTVFRFLEAHGVTPPE